MKVENLSKTYRTKGAPPVQALRGVSFTLPDTGMVFLLGRSGSGKSTLLHILSGLESFDAGDITYRGNRFADFSERDRDKYRNSCCGIIFQDYSLITELTVGENIALALRLQGERDTDERVRHALDQVGLSGCEHRRVTQLSGGQKQRVAIARALVKSPRILFADEPTGALDEQTGKDILMLLKALSKERLVFVVSHDRAFAETFGDRIIELADGQIVSDTAPAAQEEAPEPLPDLPARLPLGTALKLGCRNLLRHPVRLAFTFLLSFLSLAFIGISVSAASFNEIDAYVNALYDQNAELTAVYRYENYESGSTGSAEIIETMLGINNDSSRPIAISKADIELLEATVGTPVAPVFATNVYSIQDSFPGSAQEQVDKINAAIIANPDEHYNSTPNGYLQIDDELLQFLGYRLTGALPETPEEIAIPECLLNAFMVFGLRENGMDYTITCAEDIIGHTINLELVLENTSTGQTQPKTITGVIDTDCDISCKRSHTIYLGGLHNMMGGEHYHELLFVCEGYLPEYNYALITLPDDRPTRTALVRLVADSTNGQEFLRLSNTFSSDFYHGCLSATLLQNLCLYLCALFFIFAFLLLINFISTSVHDKLQQMGILYALGAGFWENVKIYTGSALLIGAALFLISSAFVPLYVSLANAFITYYAPTSPTLISVTFWPFAAILLIALAATFIGSFLAMLHYRKVAPAEIIRRGQSG